ncbi:DMT family transporter [bacterium]|nr:DMT family transporter [bacterium]
MPKSTARIYLELSLTTAIWGGVFLVVKEALGLMGPMKLAMCRFLLTAVVLLAVLKYRQPQAWWPARSAGLAILVTGVLTFLYQFLFFHGMNRTSPVNTAIIISANPIMTAVLAGLFLRERLHAGQKTGIGLSFTGALFVLSQGSWANLVGLKFNAGDLFLLVAVTSWATHSLLLRRWADRIAPLPLSAWASVLTALMFLPLGLAEAPAGIPVGQWTLPLVVAVGYIALLSTALASVWWYGGVMQVGPSRAAVFANLVPVFTLLFSVLLGRTVWWSQIIGAGLVIGGVYLTTRRWDIGPLPAEA